MMLLEDEDDDSDDDDDEMSTSDEGEASFEADFADQIMMAMETRLDREGLRWEMPGGTDAEIAELRASYEHLTKLRDEVVEMGLLPPLDRWSEANPNL